jgi:hypothetical protein
MRHSPRLISAIFLLVAGSLAGCGEAGPPLSRRQAAMALFTPYFAKRRAPVSQD